MQHAARPQIAASVQRHLWEVEIECLEWPTRGYRLNFIKQLWYEVKKKSG